MVENLFFELLQVSVSNRKSLSYIPSAEEWEELYKMAKEQAVPGICFHGISRLPNNQKPPLLRMRQWTVKAMKIEEQNKKVSEECRWICNAFNKAGFDAIILKGQGNGINYVVKIKDELNEHTEKINIGYLRTSGDIDVWVKPHDKSSYQPIKRTIEYCLSVRDCEFVYYHNMDFPVLKCTPVEVHYRPTWLYCPWRDHVLQRWFNERYISLDYNGYKCPTIEFNVVFQLIHIYKHLFEAGIGLRQLLDYYFVLQAYQEDNKADLYKLLDKIGLKRFAGAVMYVIEKVFACSRDIMLCDPREKEGKQLLSEIMIGGNFGHFDDRYNFTDATTPGSNFHGPTYAWLRLKHNFRFMTNYPMEVLFEPPFRLVHYMWRTFRLWRF